MLPPTRSNFFSWRIRKHFRLCLETHVGHFVEEDRSLIGQIELPPFHGRSACKGPLFMAEQFALDQIFRNRGTVDFDKGFLRPSALAVDGTGHQFLSRTVFTHNQNPGIGRSDDADHLLEVLDRAALARQFIFVADLLLEEKIFLLQADHLQRMVDHQDHLFEREGLFYEIEGPKPRRLHRRFDGAVAGHDDDLNLGMSRLDHLEDLDPVYPRKPDVQEDQAGRILIHYPQGLLAACRRHHLMPLVFENSAEGLADALFVIHNQNCLVHRSPSLSIFFPLIGIRHRSFDVAILRSEWAAQKLQRSLEGDYRQR